MFIKLKNIYEFNEIEKNNSKKIISYLNSSKLYSRLDSLYYIQNLHKFIKSSYFFSNNYDEYILRDIINYEIDSKFNVLNNIKSSIFDLNGKFRNNTSNLIQEIINSNSDISFINNNNQIDIFDISYKNFKNIHIRDNNYLFEDFEIFIEKEDLNEIEINIFELIFILFTFPLNYIPFYLTGILDFNKKELIIDKIKFISKESIIYNNNKLIINKMIKLYKLISDYIQESKLFKSYYIFYNINYFETILEIHSRYNKNISYSFIFNNSDYYRILRIFVSSFNKIKKDFIDLSNRLDLFTIGSSILLDDSNEYILEHTELKEKKRYENNIIFN